MVRRPVVLLLTLACALLMAASAHAGYDETTALQVTPGHTGFLAGGSLDRPPLARRWTRSLRDVHSPLTADGRVFVLTSPTTSGNKELLALDAADGHTLWTRSLAGRGGITYDAGVLALFESNGLVSGLDPASGQPRWSRALGATESFPAPTASGGRLFVNDGRSYGRLHALAIADGAPLWDAPALRYVSPAASGAIVLASSSSYGSGLVATSVRDGQPAWQRPESCSFGYNPPLIAAGGLALTTASGACAVAIDQATGATVGSLSSTTAPAVAGDTVVIREGTGLRAQSLQTGLLLWRWTAPGSLAATPPLIVNETVYAHGTQGAYAVDLRTGGQLWQSAESDLGTNYYDSTPTSMAAGGGLLLVPGFSTLGAYAAAPARPGVGVRILSGPEGPTAERDAAFAFTTAPPGLLQRCRLDAGAWTPCAAGAGYPGLPEGPHTFETRTETATGEVLGLDARGWSVDTRAPVAKVAGPEDGSVIGAYYYSLTGQAEDGISATECRLDEEPWAPCPTAGRSMTGIGEGAHRWQARSRDIVGNVQASPTTLSWTFDRRDPTVGITGGPTGATTATDATFTFVADEPATFRCSVDDAPFATCTSPYEMSGVRVGGHTFRVQATDRVNRTSPTVTGRWTVSDGTGDQTPPQTTITGAPARRTQGTSARFAYVSTEPGSFACRLDGGLWQNCPGTWSTSVEAVKDYQGLSDGDHRFEVRASDAVGNEDPSPATWDWTVDTVAPRTAVAMQGEGRSRAFVLTGDEDATFACTLDGGPASACESGVAYDGLADGEHLLSVRATDLAGNVEVDPQRVRFTVAPSEGPEPPASSGPGPGTPQGGATPPVAVPSPATSTGSGGPSPATSNGGGAPASTPSTKRSPAPAAERPADGAAPVPSIGAAEPVTPRQLALALRTSVGRTLTHSKRSRLHRGIRIALADDRPGRVEVSLTRRGKTLARSTARFSAPAVKRVTLRLREAGRAALRGRPVSVTLTVTVRPDDGPAVRVRRSLRL